MPKFHGAEVQVQPSYFGSEAREACMFLIVSLFSVLF